MSGCPADILRETWAASQRFERGLMAWREDQGMIYVIAADNTWRKIIDTWTEAMPEDACPDEAPAGLTEPKRGFGYAWCNVPGLKDLVGWGVEVEQGFTTHFQAFQGSEMIRAADSSVYVLLRSGWWRRYP